MGEIVLFSKPLGIRAFRERRTTKTDCLNEDLGIAFHQPVSIREARVLIITDNESNIREARRTLERICKKVACVNVREGYDIPNGIAPDIVILALSTQENLRFMYYLREKIGLNSRMIAVDDHCQISHLRNELRKEADRIVNFAILFESGLLVATIRGELARPSNAVIDATFSLSEGRGTTRPYTQEL